MTNEDTKDDIKKCQPTEMSKGSLAKRILRIVAWVIATPVLLVLLIGVLLYVPPVQRWAVNTATNLLSEETGMDISIDNIRLAFPLDLSMQKMVAADKGDTLLDAEELVVSVKLMPLFDGNVEVDGVRLKNVSIDSRDLIEAMYLKGNVGEFYFDSHTTSLTRSEAVVSHALLADTRLSITMADSVSEDTTVQAVEPVKWKVRLDDVRMRNVGLRMILAPQKDSVAIGAMVGNASLNGNLDLEKGKYEVGKLSIEGTSMSFDIGESIPAKGMIDANHIALNGIGIDADSMLFDVNSGELTLNLNNLVGKERCGLEIKEGHAKVRMDSTALSVDNLLLRTTNSLLKGDVGMDLNAFDESNPGQLSASADISLGWSDVELAMGTGLFNIESDTQPYPTNFSSNDTKRISLPSATMTLRAEGNMKRLLVKKMEATMPGAFDMKGKAIASNLTDSVKLHAEAGLKVDVWDIDFIKTWMPADVASSFNIPKNMQILVGGRIEDGVASADVNLHAADAIVMLAANYGLNSEAYRADVDISNLIVNKFVPLEEQLTVAGSLSAKGHGFDVHSPTTYTDISLLLDTISMGKIDASGTNAHLKYDGGDLEFDMACDNTLLQAKLGLRGNVAKENINANLDIDLPFVDFKGMGLSERTLEISTKGNIKMGSNWSNLFLVDAQIDGLDMQLGKDTLHTDDFKIYAESMPDSTAAKIKTGDLNIDFNSPNNLFGLIDQYLAVADMAAKQIEGHKFSLEELKKHMPQAHLRTDIGPHNPANKILALNGIKFEDLKADLRTSSENGVTGWAHMYGFSTDSIQLDTAYISLVQDSTTFLYKAGLKCDDQKLTPGFSAYLEGFLGMKDADAHITYFNKKGVKGVDLGVKGFFTDSTMHFSLYPSAPTIAFAQFNINTDNFVSIDSIGRISANIDLKSRKDDCRFTVAANPEGNNIQDAQLTIENLNLGELLTVVPFAPKMDGMVNLGANYVQHKDGFSVDGDMGASNFMYEGMKVGDIKTDFAYKPLSEFIHDVKVSLSHNGHEFAEMSGTYDTETEGSLDAILKFKDMQMSMLSPFVPDQLAEFSGELGGELNVRGGLDNLLVNGVLNPDSIRIKSEPYAVNMRLANSPIKFDNSRMRFNRFAMYGKGKNPLTLNGYIDFSDLEEMMLNLSLYGKNFQLIDSKRTRKSVIFGEMYGDFLARVNGTINDLSVRGLVSVLSNTDMTYVMADTPLSIDYRLEDIVTFVDFNAPPDTSSVREARKFMGMDMNLQLMIEDGAEFHCEFSADRQSYINVQGGGSLVMTYTPEGVLNLQGRYTINEGEMKYTLPVIPLKTFTLGNGSYIDFTGDPLNPTLNIAATERTKASVSSADGKSRSVAFDVGLKITNTLSNMGLEFTIDAPEDLTIQNELAGMSLEEKNKLAVAMLATGMYLSGSNSSGFNAGNALNNFLQNEINNIAGQALNTAVDVNVGMEQSTRDDGSTRTDYSFKFSKRLFSDRLNIVIGGKVSADGNKTEKESGAYIDDISLEWRLDNGGTRYVRVFHEKNYDNLIEGELIENGAGIVLRKKVDKLSELFIFKRERER